MNPRKSILNLSDLQKIQAYEGDEPTTFADTGTMLYQLCFTMTWVVFISVEITHTHLITHSSRIRFS